MKVLVAYATRHGSTADIAERIADRMRTDGIPAEARSVTDVDDLGPYGAIILGGAAYMSHWLKDATAFAKRHRRELQDKMVWLFSSGPLGNDVVDKDGQDILESSRPREVAELQSILHSRGDHVFFGAWDPEAPPVGVAERLLRFAPASKEALPGGDFRDWEAIDAWADAIAAELNPGTQAESGTGRAD